MLNIQNISLQKSVQCKTSHLFLLHRRKKSVVKISFVKEGDEVSYWFVDGMKAKNRIIACSIYQDIADKTITQEIIFRSRICTC